MTVRERLEHFRGRDRSAYQFALGGFAVTWCAVAGHCLAAGEMSNATFSVLMGIVLGMCSRWPR